MKFALYRCLLAIVALTLGTNAFQLPTSYYKTLARNVRDKRDLPRCLTQTFTKNPSKLKAKAGEPPPKSSPLELVFIYLTPWKNPNSIFVYFILFIWGIDFFGLGPTPH